MINQLCVLSTEKLWFPEVDTALCEPDGLLAVGGKLNLEWLKVAYDRGIFPWFNEQEPIIWWSPSVRGIIELDEFHVSKSTKKQYRQLKARITINHAFHDVIGACRAQRLDKEGTWINSSMMTAYNEAHRAGFAHSIEVWQQDRLIGGLYGIMQHGVFCGESMFFNESGASKIAMWALVSWLKRHDAHFIDCQLLNPYLASMGAKSISRSNFLAKLKAARCYTIPDRMWQPQSLGEI
ncbi:Leucyl/phenylalanyl-tRNA--protein transferase [Pseudoalteromonas luteoviolacea B = ATCC 29581]|nr:Leucyl/phenylalanyl-tRNA--protein transferase [Pseudoalteromonas luteoviolacea B = ATCC 29581]